MKNTLAAILFFFCAAIDFVFVYLVAGASIFYGADEGALLTMTIVPAGFGTVCLVGGVYVLIGGRN